MDLTTVAHHLALQVTALPSEADLHRGQNSGLHPNDCSRPKRRCATEPERIGPLAASGRVSVAFPGQPSSAVCSDSSSATGVAAFLDFDATTGAARESASASRAVAA
jgi:hypothetical protein